MQEQSISHFFSVLREKKRSYEENYKFFAPKLAPKFSIFNFVRRDENALSYIIANLLDPNGDHAQGSVFIELFTQFLVNKMGDAPNVDLNFIGESHKKAKCITESTTSNQRRIDIVIDFGNFGIGIENKPWAYDQKNQLKDYSEELRSRYGDNFLLVYLTGADWNVSEQTISQDALANLNKNNHFLQITYQDLKEWIVDCEAKCQADRVRNFLRDFADYCDIQFGNSIEMSDENLIKEYLLGNPNNIELAFQIEKVLPNLKEQIFNGIVTQVKNKLEQHSTPWITSSNFKNKQISFRKPNWTQHQITIMEYYGWCFGIRNQKKETNYLTDSEIENFAKIYDNRLKRHGNGWISSFLIYFEEPIRSWDTNPNEISKIVSGDSTIVEEVYNAVTNMEKVISDNQVAM